MKTVVNPFVCLLMSAALLILAIYSCRPDNPDKPGKEVAVTGIRLDKTTLTLLTGNEVTLKATVRPNGATDKSVDWTSSAEAVAEVDENGKVAGKSPGKATITATTKDGGFTAECAVTVYPAQTAEYVDMGNNIMWATCNVGAEKPEDYGEYFAWGETAPKDSYAWNNYAWMPEGKNDSKLINKYQFPDGQTGAGWYSGGTFKGDGIAILEAEDDVVTALWGRDWRAPSVSDWEWLLDNCEWKWDATKNGYEVTGTKGSKIFLPAAGYKHDSRTGNVGVMGNYWAISVCAENSTKARVLKFKSNNIDVAQDNRYYGFSVRPVRAARTRVDKVSLNKSSIEMRNAEIKEMLYSSVIPSIAAEKDIIWSSSNPSVATVEKEISIERNRALITAVSNGKTTITVMTVDGQKTATCEVSVNLWTGTINGHGYVDMGNGLKWATENVGATVSDPYGSYFAWGETDPKSNYSWDTYKFGGEHSLTKYVINASSGVDNLTTLELSDDAARTNWGGTWRMPTESEWEWLITNCNWTRENDGVRQVYRATSKINKQHLTFVLPGYYNGNLGLVQKDNDAYYWSSSLCNNSSMAAVFVIKTLNYMGGSPDLRYKGCSVRAVSD